MTPATTAPRTWHRGDKVTADIDGATYTGIIRGFNGSGLTALIKLTSDAPGYRAGVEVPLPVRMLKAVAP